MIKVTYRDKHWEVPGRRTVRDVIFSTTSLCVKHISLRQPGLLSLTCVMARLGGPWYARHSMNVRQHQEIDR